MCSCGAPIYDVDKLYTPLYTKKDDIQVEGNFGFTGWSATAGYALTDEFAIAVHGNYYNRYTNDTLFHNQNLYEGLISYYIGSSKDRGLYISAGFARCGYKFYGNTYGYNTESYVKTNGSYSRYSLQASLLLNEATKDPIIYNITEYKNQINVRFSYLDHTDHFLADTPTEYGDTVTSYYYSRKDEQKIEVSLAQMFPFFSVKDLYLTLQYGIVLPLKAPEGGDMNPFIASVGINYLMNFSKKTLKE